MGRICGILSCVKIYVVIFFNLFRKMGMVFLGWDFVLVCFFLMDLRYCFIDGWEIGFLILSLLFYLLFNFVFVKMVWSFLIILFMVFVVNCLG